MDTSPVSVAFHFLFDLFCLFLGYRWGRSRLVASMEPKFEAKYGPYREGEKAPEPAQPEEETRFAPLRPFGVFARFLGRVALWLLTAPGWKPTKWRDTNGAVHDGNDPTFAGIVAVAAAVYCIISAGAQLFSERWSGAGSSVVIIGALLVLKHYLRAAMRLDDETVVQRWREKLAAP